MISPRPEAQQQVGFDLKQSRIFDVSMFEMFDFGLLIFVVSFCYKNRMTEILKICKAH